MPRPILIIRPEKEILKKIRAAEIALRLTPYGSVREAVVKELEKLNKDLEEIKPHVKIF
ncbi:MAG TPA: hypothetical protein PK536_13500 [Ignavibacteria bacterium]|nr:hypothetical protein [Ignavibacteria bacterium]HRK00364.1 hypothetical protein [Ignavibacteria bacterium]